MIEVKNLVKKFGEITVLDNINIKFEKGKIHGLVGRNGSGKTMLMKCICGFVPYTSGEIRVGKKIIGKEIDVPETCGIIIRIRKFTSSRILYQTSKQDAV